MPDRQPKDELLYALQVCWPRRRAIGVLRDEFANQLEQSFVQLGGFLDHYKRKHELKTVDKPLPEVAVSLAVGYLTEQAQKERQAAEREAAPFRDFIAAAAEHDGLRDVMLTAGCVIGDDACNQTLLEIIDSLRIPLTKKWGEAKAAVLDDLPSQLLQPQKQGLNRGRAKLLSFSGRSSVKPWLRAIATHLIIDRRKGNKEVQMVDADADMALGDGHAGPPGGEAPHDVGDDVIKSQLVEIITPLFQRLLEQLHGESVQQYHYAILRCVQRRPPADIAARLNISRPRVTQLSQAVCSKFLRLLTSRDPAFGELTDRLDTKTRHDIEDAIRDMIGAVEAADVTAGTQGD